MIIWVLEIIILLTIFIIYTTLIHWNSGPAEPLEQYHY